MELFLKEGRISKEAFDKMAEGTPKDLIDRMHPKKEK